MKVIIPNLRSQQFFLETERGSYTLTLVGRVIISDSGAMLIMLPGEVLKDVISRGMIGECHGKDGGVYMLSADDITLIKYGDFVDCASPNKYFSVNRIDVLCPGGMLPAMENKDYYVASVDNSSSMDLAENSPREPILSRKTATSLLILGVVALWIYVIFF